MDPPVDAVFTCFLNSLFLLLGLTSCILHGILREDLHTYIVYFRKFGQACVRIH